MGTEGKREPGGRNDSRSVLMLAASMLIFGTIGIFRRTIPLSSEILAFFRGVIGTVFLCLFVLGRRMTGGRGQGREGEKGGAPAGNSDRAKADCPDSGLSGKTAGVTGSLAADETRGWGLTGRTPVLLLLSGALIGLNWILLFEAYKYTTIAVATLCYYMQPIIVILLSPLLFRERLTGKKILCAAAALAGMVLVSGAADGGLPQGDSLRGILYGLGAAALYASVVILNKFIRDVDPFVKTILQLGAAAVSLLPVLIVSGSFAGVEIHGRALFMLLVVGVVHTGIAYVLYFGSMAGLQAQTIALFSYIDPVSALFFSMLFLREPMTAAGLIGAALILGAALMSEM